MMQVVGLLFSFLVGCDAPYTPWVDPTTLGEVGCGFGFDDGLAAGRADRETCDFGATTSEISDERAQDLADVCFPLIASEQTGGSCLESMLIRYEHCKPGGYSLGYFGEDGDGCAVD